MHTKNLSTGCQFYFNLIKNVEKGLDADPWLAINFLLIGIKSIMSVIKLHQWIFIQK